MSFLGNMIGLADTLTKNFGLQADVVYWPYLSSDGAGKASYGPPTARMALVTRNQKVVRRADGTEAVSQAQVVFIDPTVVGEFDKIVLPVGGVLDATDAARDAAQPILATGAYVDASNGAVLTEIFLGPTVQL